MHKSEEIIITPGGYQLRIFQCIDQFRAKFGVWPTQLKLGTDAYTSLRDQLTPFGLKILKEKLFLKIVDEDGVIVAQDDQGNILPYGSYHGSPDIDSYKWLEIDIGT